MMSGRRLITNSYSLFHFYYNKKMDQSLIHSINSVSTLKQVWTRIITEYTMENKIKVASAIMELIAKLRKTNIIQ